MDIPVELWYKAISQRHSRRAFTGQRLSEDDITRLENVCGNFRPFDSARAVFVENPPEEVFRGLVGSYGKIRNAPHYIAFIGRPEQSSFEMATGYIGEAIILEATSMNRGTCWIAGMFQRDIVEKQLDLQESEQVLAITPVGHVASEKSRGEKIISGLARSHRRKPLLNLIEGDDSLSKDWMKIALEAARVAPSAANRQPWRFTIKENAITVHETQKRAMYSRISKRLDCGISMMRLELGARFAGASGTWIHHDSPQVASYIVQ
ncbi:MAG: nitroreductase family protein [Candidatus Thorarchaeota archaeon]